jgi:hypothetical protein
MMVSDLPHVHGLLQVFSVYLILLYAYSPFFRALLIINSKHENAVHLVPEVSDAHQVSIYVLKPILAFYRHYGRHKCMLLPVSL